MVEQLFGQKSFRLKTFSAEQTFLWKIFMSKIFSAENYFDRKNFRPKKFWPKKFSTENFSDEYIFGETSLRLGIFFGRFFTLVKEVKNDQFWWEVKNLCRWDEITFGTGFESWDIILVHETTFSQQNNVDLCWINRKCKFSKFLIFREILISSKQKWWPKRSTLVDQNDFPEKSGVWSF